MIRPTRSVPWAAAAAVLALVAAGCSTGTTSAPAQPTTPPPSSGGRTAPGFPTTTDGQVLDAAKLFATVVTTYDHTKLAGQRNGLLVLSGEPLKTQLGQSLADDGAFAKSVTANARDAVGSVLDLGLVSREGDRAVVVVFVDQQIASPAGNATQRLRERITLGRAKSGRWLAIKIETL